jgi:hypothetical protein
MTIHPAIYNQEQDPWVELVAIAWMVSSMTVCPVIYKQEQDPWAKSLRA